MLKITVFLHDLSFLIITHITLHSSELHVYCRCLNRPVSTVSMSFNMNMQNDIGYNQFNTNLYNQHYHYNQQPKQYTTPQYIEHQAQQYPYQYPYNQLPTT